MPEGKRLRSWEIALICTDNRTKLVAIMLIPPGDICRNVNLKFHEISIFYNAIDRSNRGQRRREPSIRSVRERDDLNFNNKSIVWNKIVGRRLEITSLLCSLPPFFSPHCRMKGASEDESEGEGSRVGTLAMFCWHWRTTTKPLLASASVM